MSDFQQTRQNCPSLAELETISGEPRADIEEHLASCERCRTLLKLITGQQLPELARGEVPKFEVADIPERAKRSEDGLGELVLATSNNDEGDLMVGVALAWQAGRDEIELAPISTRPHDATEWDLILEAGDSPLGYSVIVEVWNHGTIAADQIVEHLGMLSVDAGEQLRRLYEAVFVTDPPDDVRTGPPLLSDEDPRLLFQEEEAERARWYWRELPADMAPDEAVIETSPDEAPIASSARTAAQTLGERLATWFERSGFEVDDLARETSWLRSNVQLVAKDEIDPTLSSFGPGRLAELLAQTDIDRDELDGLLLFSVPAVRFAEPEPPRERPEVYRRSTGSGSTRRSGRAPEGEESPSAGQLKAQAQYVREVIEAFEELED
jgi:hypothetical protein